MGSAQIRHCLSSLAVLILLEVLITSSLSSTITVTNNCDYAVWPAIQTSSGSPALQPTGFALSKKGDFQSLAAPTSWAGRVWGRTLCSSDSSSGNFSCVTGDCGTSKINCSGSVSTALLATVAEFSLGGSGGMDFYDVSLVNGYNLPMLVSPSGGASGGNCNATGCSMDLNLNCPSELKVFESSRDVACKSPCTGQSLNTCQPSNYSMSFKKACPTAYSYPTDEATPTFSCTGADYVVTFCPNATGLKPGQAYENPPPPPVPPMVFLGGNDDSNRSRQDSFAVPSPVAPVISVACSLLAADSLASFSIKRSHRTCFLLASGGRRWQIWQVFYWSPTRLLKHLVALLLL